MHAAIEPIAAAVLIASSWIFGFADNGTAQALTIVVGVVMLASGAMTDWRLSPVRLIPLTMHFMTDLLLGAVLILSPFIFGFSANGGASRFVVIFGAWELVTALCTRWEADEVETVLRPGGRRLASSR
jgi:uncharacterized membrane protein HdeD (DUF308 family)